MGQRSVRVVVGQGDPARDALRDVLTRNGFDVVGEVTAAAHLAEVLAAAQPDVVVLDDAIGVDAAQIVSQVAPDAKLVVIWPAGVVPIGGAVRVDPGEVAMALSATVGLAAGVELSGPGTIDRPDWIDKVRKDPATLREKLATAASVPVRPSVTELQRRGQRLHPSTGMGRRSARSRGGGPPAAKAVLPIAALNQVAESGDPTTAGAPVEDDGSEATLNRRIGMIALGGAAVAGALMIALSFGAQRQPSVIVAEPFLPPLVSNPSPGAPPSTPVDHAPTSGGPATPAPPAEPTSTTGGPGVTTGPTAGPTGTGGSGSGSGSGRLTGGSGSGSGGPGAGRPSAAAAGASSLHNPHGGAPGLLRTAPVNAAAPSTHANGHTPHGAHPTHPVHPHKH